MAFKMRSGNKVSFKNIGSSPLKATPKSETASTQGKQNLLKHYDKYKDDPSYRKALDKAFGGETTYDTKTSISKTTKKSPVKQKLKKGGEGQDQDKIFDAKGNHIGNWVNDKKVMFNDKPVKDPQIPKPKKSTTSKHGQLGDAQKEYETDMKLYKKESLGKGGYVKKKKKSPTKQKKGELKDLRPHDKYVDLDAAHDMPVKRSGFGPTAAYDNPELKKAKKPFSKKVMKDGSSSSAYMKDPKTGKTIKVTGWTNPYAVKPKK